MAQENKKYLIDLLYDNGERNQISFTNESQAKIFLSDEWDRAEKTQLFSITLSEANILAQRTRNHDYKNYIGLEGTDKIKH